MLPTFTCQKRAFYAAVACGALLVLAALARNWTELSRAGLGKDELSELIAEGNRTEAALESVEIRCPMYQEFRHLDFLHPAVRRQLCRGVDAYRRYPDGFPMCQLRDPFHAGMLSIVRRSSEVTELMDVDNAKIKMFVYKGKDLISRHILRSHAWESQLVHWTLRFALKLAPVTFLDIGSNIGVYSIKAARLGLPVVALDANIRNLLRLRLSLNAASLNATLVWNFIAPDQRLRYLSFLADCNVGGAGRDEADLPDTVPVMPLRSERLADLVKTKRVVMKMDIQGGEADFLRMSGRLFTDFSVAAVQMEWFPPMIRGDDFAVMTDFFASRGYKAWQIPGFHPLDVEWANQWGIMDIVWVHDDFVGRSDFV